MCRSFTIDKTTEKVSFPPTFPIIQVVRGQSSLKLDDQQSRFLVAI